MRGQAEEAVGAKVLRRRHLRNPRRSVWLEWSKSERAWRREVREVAGTEGPLIGHGKHFLF